MQSKRGEFHRVVRAKEANVALRSEFRETRLVGEKLRVVHCREALKKPDPRRWMLSGGDARAVVVGVATVKEPPIVTLNRDAAVAARVAVQRDEEDFGRKPAKRSNAGKAVPRLAFGLVAFPSRLVRPLHGAKSLSREKVGRIDGGLLFTLKKMNRRVRKVGETARVIDVQVCEHNMPDVFRRIAERPELMQRGVGELKLRLKEPAKRTETRFGRRDVVRAKAGIDEDEPLAGFDEQAVTHHFACLEVTALAVDQPST